MSDFKGRPLWFDLYTTDLGAAQAFYGAVTGWTTQAHNPEYDMFVAPRGPMGGVMLLPEQAKAMGAPPHWLAYLGTPDVDASVAQVQALGGQVLAPAFDIPTVGRCAVVADPQGAAFALFTPAFPVTQDVDAEPAVGEVIWSELMTSDLEGAWAFYQALFGWRHVVSMDMPPMGLYWIYTVGGRDMAGAMMARPPEMPVSAWLYYFSVADLDRSTAMIKEHGGQVMHGPIEVPGEMRVVMATDPQGAWFALHGK